MDLPQSLTLAGNLVGWPRAQADSSDMAAALASGSTLCLNQDQPWRIIPPSVRMALELGSERQNLPHTARTLATMYQNEAESRAAAMGAILSPLMLLLIALLILIVLAGLMTPIVRLFQALS
jgi:type II secretory pathway component PulF